MKDFYYILGINDNSTLAEIKEAYRKLSKKFHPDLNQNDQYFEGRFKELQEAYEILSDPGKRKRYDSALAAFKSGMPAEAPQKPRNKTIWIDIAFTLILISITLVFGAYVKKAMSSTAINKTTTFAKVNTVPLVAAVKHHKKRHNLKLKAVDNTIRANPIVAEIHPDKTVIVPVKPTPAAKVVPVKPVTLANIHPAEQRMAAIRPKQTVTDSNSVTANKNYLYATYIHSNITGVTNMHQNGSYSSAVVAAIPTNSQVFVLAKGDTYYKVIYSNNTGYVPKWSLKDK